MTTKTTSTAKKTGANIISQKPAQKAEQLFNDIKKALHEGNRSNEDGIWRLPPLDSKKDHQL